MILGVPVKGEIHYLAAQSGQDPNDIAADNPLVRFPT